MDYQMAPTDLRLRLDYPHEGTAVLGVTGNVDDRSAAVLHDVVNLFIERGRPVALDLAGFAVSTGSACHSGSVKPSHAITSLGYGLEEARSVLRFSMLPDAQPGEVEALVATLKRLI